MTIYQHSAVKASAEYQDRILQLWEDPVEFGRLWHDGVLEVDGTRRKEYSRVHRLIADHALSSQFTSTIISRNHGKTTFFGDLALWEKWHNINDTFMYCSAGTDLATSILADLKGIALSTRPLPIIPGELEMTFGQAFPELMPIRAPKGAPSGSFNCAGRTAQVKEPCFFPKSPRSSKAGLHPDRIYVDDASNENNSTTPQLREFVINFIRQLIPILRSRSSGVIRVIGTPWAFWDVSAFLQENPEFKQLRFGCWDGVNPETGLVDGQGPGPKGGWPIAPSFMTAAELFDQERQIDNPEFWSEQYLCKPKAASYALFTEELLESATQHCELEQLPPGPNILLWDPTSRADAKIGDWNGLVLVRASTAERAQAAGLALPGLAEMPADTNLFFTIESHEIKGPPGDCQETIERIHRTQGIDEFWVEDTGSSGGIFMWLHNDSVLSDVPRIPIALGGRSANKDRRLQATQVALKEGRVRLVSSAPGHGILTQRLSEFPKSESDDLPDALALLTWRGKRKGILPKIDVDKGSDTYYNAQADPSSLAYRPPAPGRRW